MIRIRFKKVLLLSPIVFPAQLLVDYEYITQINALTRIFPAIYENTPNLVILDYNYLGKDTENVIRRIRSNSFYNKIKISCYKSKSEPKKDGLLKAIGVDFFIYQEDLQPAPVVNSLSNIFTEIVDSTLMVLAPKVSN